MRSHNDLYDLSEIIILCRNACLEAKRACMHLFYWQQKRTEISTTRNLEWNFNTVSYTTNVIIS